MELVKFCGVECLDGDLLPDSYFVVKLAVRADYRLGHGIFETEHSAVRHGLNLVAGLDCVRDF